MPPGGNMIDLVPFMLHAGQSQPWKLWALRDYLFQVGRKQL